MLALIFSSRRRTWRSFWQLPSIQFRPVIARQPPNRPASALLTKQSDNSPSFEYFDLYLVQAKQPAGQAGGAFQEYL